jgi:hypothetical protein
VSFSPSATAVPIDQLRATVRGRVITPDDADYDAARTIVSGEFDPRPPVIVRVADASDVASVVSLARETGTELAVRCGGHSGAGHGTTDVGIVLDLRDMRALDIDVEGRTAWAEAGLTAGEVTTAAAAHGLAIGFGDTGSVGIGGLTLGGGVGYLARKHGLTIDSLLAAEIVTADGELLRVDADTHPDLFWAIRGGGGNFGVATRLLRGRHAGPAGHGRDGRRLHRRLRGRARGADDDRERHERAADAVPARGGARPARHPGHDRVRRRRGDRRARHCAVPSPGHPAGRHGQADALPGDVPTRWPRRS